MDIRFDDKHIHRVCTDDACCKKKYGANNARILKRRLSALCAARNLSEIVHGNLHPLKREYAGHFALNLDGGYRLIFRPDHDPVPQLPDGGLDLQGITIVAIVEIKDYHD